LFCAIISFSFSPKQADGSVLTSKQRVENLRAQAAIQRKEDNREGSIKLLLEAVEIEKSGRNKPTVLKDLWKSIAWSYYFTQKFVLNSNYRRTSL
jgi:hypothetical protein